MFLLVCTGLWGKDQRVVLGAEWATRSRGPVSSGVSQFAAVLSAAKAATAESLSGSRRLGPAGPAWGGRLSRSPVSMATTFTPTC